MRPIGPGAPMRTDGWPRSILAFGASERSGRWPSRVWITSMPAARAASSTALQGATAALEQRHIVAERFPEAARLEEVALHVDDDECGASEIERYGFGLSLDGRVQEILPGRTNLSLRSKIEAKRCAVANRRIRQGIRFRRTSHP